VDSYAREVVFSNIVMCMIVFLTYYALRNVLAKYFLLLNLTDCFESLVRNAGVLNPPEKLQFWQIAQPSLSL